MRKKKSRRPATQSAIIVNREDNNAQSNGYNQYTPTDLIAWLQFERLQILPAIRECTVVLVVEKCLHCLPFCNPNQCDPGQVQDKDRERAQEHRYSNKTGNSLRQQAAKQHEHLQKDEVSKRTS